MAALIPTVITRLIEAGASVVGVRHGTEEPLHTLERITQGVELRHYRPRIAGETTVTGNELAARSARFRRLARYIFRANHDAAKIAMTAPAAEQPSPTGGQKIAVAAPVSQHARSGGRVGDSVLHARRKDNGIAARARQCRGQAGQRLGRDCRGAPIHRQPRPPRDRGTDRRVGARPARHGIRADRPTVCLVLRPALDHPDPAPQRDRRCGQGHWITGGRACGLPP